MRPQVRPNRVSACSAEMCPVVRLPYEAAETAVGVGSCIVCPCWSNNGWVSNNPCPHPSLWGGTFSGPGFSQTPGPWCVGLANSRNPPPPLQAAGMCLSTCLLQLKCILQPFVRTPALTPAAPSFRNPGDRLPVNLFLSAVTTCPHS